MMRRLLEAMIEVLKTEHAFEVCGSHAEIRKEALDSGTHLYHAQMFLEWLKVCPEARDFLAAQGWPFDGPTPSLSHHALQDAPAKQTDNLAANEFFAFAFGGHLSLVALEEVLGEVLKVVEARPSRERAGVPRRSCITAAQVPEHLRGRLEQVLSGRDSKNSGASWAAPGSPAWKMDNEDGR